jgi:hypothetical protein
VFYVVVVRARGLAIYGPYTKRLADQALRMVTAAEMTEDAWLEEEF